MKPSSGRQRLPTFFYTTCKLKVVEITIDLIVHEMAARVLLLTLFKCSLQPILKKAFTCFLTLNVASWSNIKWALF